MQAHPLSANTSNGDSDSQAFFMGTVMRKVFGVGINDAARPTRTVFKIAGKQVTTWECPYYSTWKSMLRRCYSERWLAMHPSYLGVYVCPEWHFLSSFALWMEGQDYSGMHLDKDILSRGERVYSPETCVFIPEALNVFIADDRLNKGLWPTGVHFSPDKGKFIAQINYPTGKRRHLGAFLDPQDAHAAWRKEKHRIACEYADMQTDPRISQALRTRYLPSKEAT